jgi:TatD DNase family protein
MEYAYRYGDPRRLYLNATNRCTNRCTFCVRYQVRGLGGAILRGEPEPDFPMLKTAVQSKGGLESFDEFVWCGFGEPTFRLDLIVEAASWLRSCGAQIRLNTNGHSCLIHGRDVLPELSRAVDEVSVSLNAPDCNRYLRLCCPDPNTVAMPGTGEKKITAERFWESMLDFLARAPAFFKRVQASVVGFVLTDKEIEECRQLALSAGIPRFRVR